MSTYRQNLSRQKKSAIKSRDQQPKKLSEASPVNFNITGKRSGRSKPPLPASPSGFANYVTGLVDSATPKKELRWVLSGFSCKKEWSISQYPKEGGLEGLYKRTGSCWKNSLVLGNTINSTLLKELWSKALLSTDSNFLNINRQIMGLRRRLPRKKFRSCHRKPED